MITAWNEVKLGDICAVKGGKRLPGGHVLVDYPTTHPYIKARDIRHGKVSTAELQFLEPATFEKIKRYTVRQGDVCITIVANIGDVGIVPKELDGASLTENAVKLTNFRKDVDPRFLALQLAHRQFKGFMELLAAGAAQSKLGIYKIKIIKVRLPQPVTQAKIAAILSAYDDLIENNRRRIALLEQLAEEIYREWFVRLRFPGYEKVKILKGVPEKWKVLPFSQLVNINPLERIDKSEEVPFVGMENLSLNSMFFAPKETRRGGLGAKFRNRDVLFPRITPSVENGKRGFVMCLDDGQVGLGSTEFIVLREKVIGPEYIYFLTCSSDFRKHAELSMTGASGRQRVQEDCFSFFLVKTPPEEIRGHFSEIVQPHFYQINLLSRQIDHLTKTRDLLLPRLVSGKLSVENLDIRFPPGMIDELDDQPIAAHA